ncbi:hypothetical protein [Coprococcus comes]|jgi:hypothetical protein|uniref:Uncharacterized protein n=1 Tax=Coprococcus comes TaxID=410072 RepID=A0A3E4GNK0_9FIRM|nr:hypothetical protein [Coprococcus comes]RGJ22199.1 hypothetical protein DXD67_10960 [Coprococcus comes]
MSIDSMLSRVKGNCLTLQDLELNTRKLNLGDEVIIPVELMDEYNEKEYPNGIKAVVVQRCKNHIVFRLQFGYNRSILKVDCDPIIITRPSNFSVYDENMSQRDVLDALAKSKQEEKENE